MSALVLAFCAHEDRQAVARSVLTPDPPMLLWHDAAGVDVAAQHRPLILLAIGPEGGVELARWIEAHGLDGVAGIGLVGVTAPWAERGVYIEPGSGVRYGASCIALGPLEPLRAVAERARWRCPARCGFHESGGHPDDRHGMDPAEKVYGRKEDYRLRLVLACAPDDGVCGVCLGERRVVGAQSRVGPSQDPLPQPCPGCSGTGKALSSADVSAELLGQGGDTRWEMAVNGGVSAQMYQTRAELDKHGLAAVLKAVGP